MSMEDKEIAVEAFDLLLGLPTQSEQAVKLATTFTEFNREFFRRSALQAKWMAGSQDFDPANPHVYAANVAYYNAIADTYLRLYDMASNQTSEN